MLPCVKALATLAYLLHASGHPVLPQVPGTQIAVSHATPAPASDFVAMDRWALAAPPAAARSVHRLADYLVRPARSEADRARAIYRWETANVRWCPSAEVPDAAWLAQDATTVLRRRTAVCSGFANLYAALAKAAGLRAVVVTGTCRGASWDVTGPDSLPHAWNAVRIAGRWQLVDVSWSVPGPDSPERLDRLAPPETFYFCAAPERLIHTHFPDNPRWQLLPRALTRAEHERLLVLQPAFYHYGLQVAGAQTETIESSPELRMDVGAPKDVILMAMMRRGSEVVGAQRLAEYNGRGYQIAMDVPPGAQYSLSIYAKHRDTPAMFQQVLRLNVDVTQPARIAARPTAVPVAAQ